MAADSAPGALLPYIEAYYNIDYTTVSLLFVATAIGFILAAPFTSILQTRLARGKVLVLAQTISTIGYAIISSRRKFCSADIAHLETVLTLYKAPFPAVVVSFFLYGLATAWSLALNNVFCVSLHALIWKHDVHSNQYIPGIINKCNNTSWSLPRLLRNWRYNWPSNRHGNGQFRSNLVRLLHHPSWLRHSKRGRSILCEQKLRKRFRNTSSQRHTLEPTQNSRPHQSHPKTHHYPRSPLHLCLPRRRSLPLRLDPLLPPRNTASSTFPIPQPRLRDIWLLGRRNPRPLPPLSRRPSHRRKTRRHDPHRHRRSPTNRRLARS